MALVIALLGCTSESRAPTPEEGDLRVLESLAEHGSDLSQPHPIDFYLYFPEKGAAKQACARLRSSGYTMLRLDQSDHDGSWLCLVQKLVVPTPVAIATERSALSALASSHGGEYDGWEAPILRPE